MSLVFGLASPGIEGVVDDHALGELLVIVAKVSRQPQGDGQQPGRLGRQLQVLGVGSSRVHSLAELFRAVWQLGNAGVDVPLMLSVTVTA